MSFKSTLIAVVACCVTTMATSRLNGDTIYYDNFSDGSATDGSPVTWTKFSQWPLTTVTVIDGDMHLSASRANELGLVGVREEFTDTSLRTQVRLIDATGEQGVGVIVRGDPDR
ncbi:MAG: hypothetical protein KDA92_13940, partial [Planctomycetales bacterium]|nr:hypothetical protein [Planctomycetales bacterium]